MKFYLQFGVPNGEPRWFIDDKVHPLSCGQQEIEADDWKSAREMVGPIPTKPPCEHC